MQPISCDLNGFKVVINNVVIFRVPQNSVHGSWLHLTLTMLADPSTSKLNFVTIHVFAWLGGRWALSSVLLFTMTFAIRKLFDKFKRKRQIRTRTLACFLPI